MANAYDLVEPLRAAMVPVPAVQPAVCELCRTGIDDRYDVCIPCRRARDVFGLVPAVLPITMSIHGGEIHNHLRGYKDAFNQSVRQRMTLRLAGLLAIFFDNHLGCIGEFDAIATIPSPSRDAFAGVLNRLPALRPMAYGVLERTDIGSKDDLLAERFTVHPDVEGQRVLLLDDTFTSGASLYSAAEAIARTGASIVGPVVIGRHLRRDWIPSAQLLGWLEEREWADDACGLCGGAHELGGQRELF